MKKNGSVLFITFFICLLVACNSDENEVKAIFTGTIMEIHGQSALVKVEEGEILKSADKVSVDLSVNSEVTFEVGDKVRVGYDGEVRESYPAGVNVIYVELIE